MEVSPKELAIKRTDKFKNRPTIVFLHDSLGCIKLWRGFPEKLGETVQCNTLSYDRLGYGESPPFVVAKRDKDYLEKEAEVLNELLNYWGINEAVLFGHSDGGSIALITAAEYPQKIRGIITEGAHIFVEELTLKGIKEAVELYQTTDLREKLTKYHGNKTDEVFWAWASTWTSEDFSSWNIEMFLGKIKCPSLVIQGEDDEFGTLAQVEGIISQTSGPSTKLIVKDAKHNPHKESPELVLSKSSHFINQML